MAERAWEDGEEQAESKRLHPHLPDWIAESISRNRLELVGEDIDRLNEEFEAWMDETESFRQLYTSAREQLHELELQLAREAVFAALRDHEARDGSKPFNAQLEDDVINIAIPGFDVRKRVILRLEYA